MTTTIVDRRNGISEGVAIKLACRVATTANIALSGLQTIDGVALAADDRVLVKEQTDASENGIYVAASGVWERAPDFDGSRDIVDGTRAFVLAGSTAAGEYYVTASDDDIAIGTTDLTFTAISGSIAADSVTYAKIQNVSATNRILGRITSGAGDIEELTPANARTIINVEDGADVTDATNVDAAGAVMEADTSTASMSFVVDEDNMASDSDTKVPTQQSVKAYVDTHVADTTTHGTTGNIVGTSDSQTLTNKTIDADSNTLSNLEVADFKASAIVTEAEGLASSDNDTSIPTAAAVKDYVDDSIVASGGGDMLASTYDPQAIEADAFDVDNHTDGTTNKVFSAAEQTKLAGIETAADVTDATNVDAAGAVMNTDTSTASMQFVIDEDDMTSDSATKVPTQQSVKAYVDAEVAGAGGGGTDIVREARTSNTILGTADKGKLIEITSGTFSQTFTAAATLGSGWFVYIYNSGSGDITLDPNSTEQIDGLVTYIMYPGETRLITCSGSAFETVVLNPFSRTWTATAASGFTKPPGYSAFEGLLWGSGAAGARGASAAGGGAGASCVKISILASAVGATEDVTIGATVAGRGTNGSGNNGNDSSFGSIVTAYGGGGGDSGGAGGGGAGTLSASPGSSNGGSPLGGTSGAPGTDSTYGGGGGGSSAPGAGGKSIWGGGGGAGASSGSVLLAGTSVYGGGGGGGARSAQATSGGNSIFGGDGGAGGASASATAGSTPGGGGGGSVGGTSGDGARGELRLWGIC